MIRCPKRAKSAVSSLAASVLLAAGCSGGGSGNNAMPPSGSTAGIITASTAAVDFGQTQVGSTSTQTVTLSASGSSVMVSSAQVSGVGFSRVSPALPSTVATGNSMVLTIQFAPQTVGQLNGSLVIGSDASDTSLTVALSGSGIAAAVAHSALLSWDTGDPTAIEYRVYRSVVSGGPYTSLTTAPLTVTTYTDSAITAGSTYFYVVTELDAAGTESQFSSEVSATVPSP